MKKIFLIRHAKSDWSNPFLEDFDRPLNARGQKNAPQMAEIFAENLHQNHISLDAIISSPSVRTRETLAFFQEKISPEIPVIFEEKIYEAPYENIIKMIHSLDEKFETVAIIGHNPGLLDTAVFLSGRYFDNIPTCGIVEMDFEVENWKNISKNSAEVVSFEYPKKYKNH